MGARLILASLYMSKAFDTIPHTSTLKLDPEFLANRTQYVVLNVHTVYQVLLGLPQGSVLEPVLFLSYLPNYIIKHQAINMPMMHCDTG